MNVASGWGLSLTNLGVEAEEPKLEGQRSSGGSYTPSTHVIDVPPIGLACLLQFYKEKSSASSTPLVYCVAVGVCLQQRSAHQNDRVSAFDFAMP